MQVTACGLAKLDELGGIEKVAPLEAGRSSIGFSQNPGGSKKVDPQILDSTTPMV